MIFSLSTCWNSHRHEDGYEMLKEIADLGFAYVELSHGIRISLVAGILRAVEDGVIKVSSVHNFCPLPMGVSSAAPNLFQPTAKDRRERVQWYRNTVKTIEFAARVGADLMVIHSGSVRFRFRSPGGKLEAFREAHVLDENPDARTLRVFAKLQKKTLNKLERKQQLARERVVQAYHSILPAARAAKVRLGIENREGIEEFPADHGMQALLVELGEPEWFGYWHDTGHAELKHRLGLVDHRSLLRENAARQFGFHLHDVSPRDRDHRAVGSGVIDWEMVGEFIRPEHILVLELSPGLTSDEVMASKLSVEERLLKADVGA